MKKVVYCDDVPVGGNNLITVQSMINTEIQDIEASLEQIKLLENNGCDIVRVAIKNYEDAQCLKKIKESTNIPIIADIQFDYKVAIESVKNGASGIRINPGNIGSEYKVKEIIDVCKYNSIPIRVGVNSGSVKKEYAEKYKGINKDSLVESALEQVRIIEKFGYDNIVISIKASDVKLTYDSNIELSNRVEYPIHLGITEAGCGYDGIIKSSMGLGSLLLQGIGDTIRVSLTQDPVDEVIIGRKILQFLGIRPYGVDIISCPTCGRTKIDLINIVKEFKQKLNENPKLKQKNIKIAIMGCAVNGPGEAKEADIGVAGGDGEGILFKKGKIIRKIKEQGMIDLLIEEMKKI